MCTYAHVHACAARVAYAYTGCPCVAYAYTGCMCASHGRARSLQAGPVQANLAARRAAEGLPAPATGLAADAATQIRVGDRRGD